MIWGCIWDYVFGVWEFVFAICVCMVLWDVSLISVGCEFCTMGLWTSSLKTNSGDILPLPTPTPGSPSRKWQKLFSTCDVFQNGLSGASQSRQGTKQEQGLILMWRQRFAMDRPTAVKRPFLWKPRGTTRNGQMKMFTRFLLNLARVEWWASFTADMEIIIVEITFSIPVKLNSM